jgi:hypothetical protein
MPAKKEPKNPDSHVIIYAKGWYKKTNIIEDLKIIYARRCGLKPEHMCIPLIYDCLTTLVYEMCIKSKWDFRRFMVRMFSEISADGFAPRMQFFNPNMEHVIEIYLSMLALVEVYNPTTKRDIIPMDKPDYSILPRALVKDHFSFAIPKNKTTKKKGKKETVNNDPCSSK